MLAAKGGQVQFKLPGVVHPVDTRDLALTLEAWGQQLIFSEGQWRREPFIGESPANACSEREPREEGLETVLSRSQLHQETGVSIAVSS